MLMTRAELVKWAAMLPEDATVSVQVIAPARITAPTCNPAAALLSAFDRLDSARRLNFVSLVPLRQAVPTLSRETFNATLDRLRRNGTLTLSSAEGRHGITEDERQAGLTEDGTLLLYVSRKV